MNNFTDYVKEFLMKNAILIDRVNSNNDSHSTMNNTCCGITTIPVKLNKLKTVNVNCTVHNIGDLCSGVLVWNVVQNSAAHKYFSFKQYSYHIITFFFCYLQGLEYYLETSLLILMISQFEVLQIYMLDYFGKATKMLI